MLATARPSRLCSPRWLYRRTRRSDERQRTSRKSGKSRLSVRGRDAAVELPVQRRCARDDAVFERQQQHRQPPTQGQTAPLSVAAAAAGRAAAAARAPVSVPSFTGPDDVRQTAERQLVVTVGGARRLPVRVRQ